MRKDLTAILIVHNEENVIERALKSVKQVTSNILVIHDGKCTDNTIRICKKYDCDIHIRKRTGDAEIHRAWSYRAAKTKWILQVDADEYLSDGLIKNIHRLLDNKKVDCWELLWPYFDGEKYRTKNWPYKKALFKKYKISFLALPHEEVVIHGVVRKTRLKLNHEPVYDNFSFERFTTKHQKWTNIHARYLLKNPDEYDRYPKNNTLEPHYYFIAKHPLLYSVPLFIYHLFGLLLYGGIKEGWFGFRNSFFQSLYYLFLCFKVNYLKHHMSQIFISKNYNKI